MYQDAERRLRHDVQDPDAWGEEMLFFLRQHDEHFERWRHEQLAQMDDDYRRWKQERFAGDFSRWRAAAREPFGTGVAADEDRGNIAMPLPAEDLPDARATIRPDADAARHREALREFHGE
jgi:hypothetical protein